MGISSPTNAPPSSPPLLPRLSSLDNSHSYAPSSTSELSEIVDSTPVVSESESDDEDVEFEEGEDAFGDSARGRENVLFCEKIARDTQGFFRHKRRYNFERLFVGWICGRDTKNRPSGPRMAVLRRVLKAPLVQQRLQDAGIRIQFAEEDATREIAGVPALRSELLSLKSEPAFSTFNPRSFIPKGSTDCEVKDVCNTQWIERALSEAWSQVEARSPRIVSFLSKVLINQRANRPSYRGDKSFDTTRACLIIAVLLNAIAPSQSNFLSRVIGIYLHSSGVPRRVIDTFSKLGVSASYTTVLSELEKMATSSLVRPSNTDFIGVSA
ncbi:hypothetical protein GGR53DRAFT_281964 [Hypoxylon sp. FL1150]|nr:hypothetical protein GGR53DRAFT_281964 [Hypoxylon sp. FL1150]